MRGALEDGAEEIDGVADLVRDFRGERLHERLGDTKRALATLLGMTPVEVQKVIFQTLEGHLRSILGTLTVEEVNSDRQSFAQKLTTEWRSGTIAATWYLSALLLMVFGGGGYSKLRNAGLSACGNITECPGSDSGFGFGGNSAARRIDLQLRFSW